MQHTKSLKVYSTSNDRRLITNAAVFGPGSSKFFVTRHDVESVGLASRMGLLTLPLAAVNVHDSRPIGSGLCPRST
jgi:hypothetical protein